MTLGEARGVQVVAKAYGLVGSLRWWGRRIGPFIVRRRYLFVAYLEDSCELFDSCDEALKFVRLREKWTGL